MTQLRNLISAPEMQRATYKRIGFPVPFILAGRWGLTTLPLRNPLVYVIGRPLQPPPGWAAERRRQLFPEPHPSEAKDHPLIHGASDNGAAVAVAPAAGKKKLRQRRRRHPQLLLPAGTPPALAHGEHSGSGSPCAPSAVVTVPQSFVDEYHCRFYAALAALWGRYHERHPVLRHAELLLEWGKHGPPSNFKRYLRQVEEEQAAQGEGVVAVSM